jgi:hypothetical protein
MYAGGSGKEGAVNDYLLQEMVRIRMDELRAEAARAREARGAWEQGRYLGILGFSGTPRAERGGFTRGTMEEACCA